MHLLTRAADLAPWAPTNLSPKARIAYRLSNTTQPLRQLVRNPNAILLENALLDTTQPANLPIPASLRAQGDPGAYLVQARGPLDESFRALLRQAGARMVCYIPNNACLVRASQAVARQLAAAPQTQAVLPYEPYYKLKPWLLQAALDQVPLPGNSTLRVLLFGEARQATVGQLQQMGVTVVGEEPSPFGPVLEVRPPPAEPWAGQSLVPALAQLAGVQEVELAWRRVPANDLSRATTGVAVDSVVQTNYLNLGGSNVLVALEDSGVDATHPDLVNRVFGDSTNSLIDRAGHGTHVAGIIAGDGTMSTTVTNASGSVMPTTNGHATNFQFRGKAPAAKLFSMTGGSDYYLQQTAARTNALISNNSWTYGNNEYDLAAASYDAAVRDTLPDVPGSQPVLYVFATGSGGTVNVYDNGANDNGLGGHSDTIYSPATAKNVITVGAIEQLRHITNEVWQDCRPDPSSTNGSLTCSTNQPWLLSTDSGDLATGFQVAKCSGRGNVGVYAEGDFGRFKPDVVAPGTFVVSTRSSQWDEAAYYNPTSYLANVFPDAVVEASNLWQNVLFVPASAVQVTITLAANAGSPVPFPNLPIFVRQADFPTTNSYDFVGTNQVAMPPDHPLIPVGDTWHYAVGNTTTQSVTFDVVTVITLTNEHGNFFQVLSNMNNELGTGPYYRYESGTSMAAADVSGMLALMQEFFEQRLGRTNSPALMKGLLINGARSLSLPYDFGVTNEVNFQGWGLVNLPTTIPGALTNLNAPASSMFVFDQDPANALATGQSCTRLISVSSNAQDARLSMRLTLVWTDPPANPVVGVKLVNDLDLIVTNLDTGEVYFGNDIQAGNTANLPWDTNSAPNLDVVNNVENVYLGPPLGTNYSITVVGRRVNVNAVSAQTNNVVQDYALVLSCGDGEVTNALTLTPARPVVSSNLPYVTVVANMFTNTPGYSGGVLLHQHVGASSPLLGTNAIEYPTEGNAVITLGVTNQWHFYMLTNDNAYTNAVFLTLYPYTLSVPRMGPTNVFDPTNATRPEPDIDLYVSTDFALTNLDPGAVSNAWKSVGPGGFETVMLSNAVLGIYYVGVKAEDQLAAEYGFMGVFSLNPFSEDQNGNQLLRGFPSPAPIPDGTPERPGSTWPILAVAPTPIKLHRAIVTNVISHELVGDLLGTLTHGSGFVVLNNHATNLTVVNWVNIYDDSDQHDIALAHHTDGPGSLMSFAGKQGSGQWLLTQVDNAAGHLGTNDSLFIYLERQLDLLAGIYVTLHPGACDNEYLDVPANATNLTVTALVVSNVGPINLTMQLCPLEATGGGCKSTVITNQVPTSLSIDQFDNPPLTAGTYYVRICNHGIGDVTIYLKATLLMNRGAIAVSVPDSAGPVTIQDDAITYATIEVTNHMLISDLEVGLLIDDPRISDLAITLIGPSGKRVLLFQDRGGTSTNGLGTFSANASPFGLPVFAYTNLAPFWTNNFDAAPIGLYGPGARFQGWTVLSNEVNVYPDYSVPWLQNNFLVLGEGVVSNSLPTTNSTRYRLTFRATHAPYLVGMVTWWPLDGDARDIWGGLDGLLYGDVAFSPGKVVQAYYDRSFAFYGDGVATKMMVPAYPELNLERRPGFSLEGWINPANVAKPAPLVEWYDPTTPFPLGVQFWLGDLSSNRTDAGILSAALWDTNSQPHFVVTGPQVLTNAGWQHVALTYDGSSLLASLYTNGYLAAAQALPAGAVPRTTGDFYLGFDPPAVPTFAYPNFASTPGLNLVNSTAPMGSVLRLTPAAQAMNGAAWYSQKVLCSGGFSTAFRFQISSRGSVPVVPPGGGAEGFSFSIQNAGPNVPATQYGPNLPIQPGWSNWISVCFIVGSAGIPGPADNSVGVRIGPGGWVAATNLSNTPINLSDGQVHLAQIECDGRAITVIVDNHPVIAGFPIPLAQAMDAGGYSWAGFGAATSEAWENHDILSWTFNANLPNPGLAYAGGLDEWSLYARALSAQEVLAIFNTSTNGKYGTNALSSPVALRVSLATAVANLTYTFTNGLTWTNGPQWETNIIDFTNTLLFASTNGPATNFTPIILTPLDPNVAVDDFVLSAVTTNYLDGLMHFTDNTNLAVVPIKFAPWPYVLSNNPPTLVFSNSFLLSTAMVFATSNAIPGGPSRPEIGIRDWTVLQGPVTVVSNATVDAMHTNFLALATGALQSTLPTVPGHRYQLSYTLRGPCAVGWWGGAVNPLDQRAQDLIGGNDGALINGAASLTGPGNGYVGDQALFFPGMITNGVAGNPYFASKIELGDPENLRLTNSFTIEGWLMPLDQTNQYVNTLGPESFLEQVFFRGDLRDCMDPYYLALERTSAPGATPEQYDLQFHIEDALGGDCGVILETADHPITAGNWYHVAAVFECNYHWADNAPWPTNMLRLYVNGQYYTNVFLEDPSFQRMVYSSYTGRFPFRDLDPAYSPGVAIGNCSRADASQPFRGFIDELSVYGRALTDPEIKAIYDAARGGKADFFVPPGQGLAKLSVSLDDVQMDVVNGDNAQWSTSSFLFTAYHTNTVLTLQGLLPGTLLDGVSLTEVPSELYYLPEDSLDPFLGQDAFGTWRLEMVDTRAGPGPDTNLVQMVHWELDFKLFPSNPPPIIELSHGIPYTNTLVGFGAQNFIVQVPLWATNATNVLLSALDRAGNPWPMGVLYDTNFFPTALTNVLFWPPVNAPRTNILSTNGASAPVLPVGKPYFLTVTNPNPLAVEFAIGVWFDILTLTNCEILTNGLVGPAGIPRYFQFDVPTNRAPPDLPQNVTFWLGNANSNLTVVLSQHLPLPDPGHYDYISQQPGTNREIVMVVQTNLPDLASSPIATNSTPWPIQTNRWYVGVFNTAEASVAFAVQACYLTNYPDIILLTNGIPYVAPLTNKYVAPPGPPRWFFFRFPITNYVDGVLFELYDLSGDADLLLQRDLPPTMAPYFAGSFQPGASPEQIVVRTSAALPDLRGNWYLGVYNNELTNNVAYRIRATLPVGGVLPSALPTVITSHVFLSNYLLLSWNSILGEWYAVDYTDNTLFWTLTVTNVFATTPVTTWVVPMPTNGYYTVINVPAPAAVRPPLTIKALAGQQLRISWPINYQGFTLQYSLSLSPPVWANVNLPVVIEGNEFVVYDTPGATTKFYRLIQ
jgi:subtilisin-like proprotein convertase family protein